MKLFNLDSPVMVFLSKVANLMILNVLTIICCIPIFTAGAAITALYYVTIKMARGDDPYIIKGYFKSFKENFKQATIIWLIMLVILAIIAVDWRVTLVMMTGNSAKIMKTVLFIVSFLLLLTGLYIFPVLSRFDNTVKNTFRNAFLISFMNLPKSVLIVIIHLIPVALLLVTIQGSAVSVSSWNPGCRIFQQSAVCRDLQNALCLQDRYEGENLAPLSFIVEEEQAKQAALEAEAAAKTAESAENKTETDAVETENQI